MRINRVILLLLALVLLVSASLTGSTSTVRASDNGVILPSRFSACVS